MRSPDTSHLRTGAWTGMVLAAFLVGGCGDADLEEVPEVAEIEVEEGEVELDEEMILGPDDVGESFMLTGWVSGLPLPGGFFLRTEGNRLIFVESDVRVSTGDVVRVTGTLAETAVTLFEGWERDAFDTGIEPEWEVERVYYIDATSVAPSNAPTDSGTMPDFSDTTSASMGGDTAAGDTASGRG